MARASSHTHESAGRFLQFFVVLLAVPEVGNREWGGSRKGGRQIVERAAFSSRGNLLLQLAREFLLKIDTSLAIATSGLRTNLLFAKSGTPSENPPFDFPKEGPEIEKQKKHFRSNAKKRFPRARKNHCRLKFSVSV